MKSVLPGIDEKVAFLKRPESYPSRPSHVETVETHMAWVFLTDRFAYKLKKPVRYDYLDFSTVEARRLDTQREVQLNRRLAPDVYHGVVPLTQESRGILQIGGSGSPIDWLVKMRRLPSDRMLDRVIQTGTVEEADIRRAATVLCDFYRQSPPIEMTPEEYCRRLTTDIRENVRELTVPEFGLRPEQVQAIAQAQRSLIEQHAPLMKARVEAGHVIDAHGDLRPEHICLEPRPVIIDCLEFNREFRILDTASELSFLTLECDRLGAKFVGRLLWDTYLEKTGDAVPEILRRFYRSFHALMRAKIAIWHLKDAEARTPDSWKPKAEHYLELAAQAIA